MFPTIILTALKAVLFSFFSDAIIKKAAFGGLRYLASKTDNDLDDEIVAMAEAKANGDGTEFRARIQAKAGH